MKKYSKAERQSLLKEMIRRQVISDQVELLLLLRQRGVEITQATVSRDLQELGVVKIRGEKGLMQYALLDAASKNQLRRKMRVYFENFVTRIDDVELMVLIHTTPGNASGLANFIDRMQWPEVLGTIAGDDTVLVVTASHQARGRVVEIFQSMHNPSGL